MRSTSALLLLLLISVFPGIGFAEPAGSQLVIYVETTTETVMPASLELGSVTLRSESRSTILQPVRRVLDSGDLAGAQRLFIDQSIAAGHYDTLHFQLAGMTTHVGAAPVTPELPAAGVAIPLDLEIRDRECGFLVLRWRPRIPEEDVAHVPDLTLHRPTVPPLGSLAFVTNEKSDNLSVIDEATGRVVDCIAVGAQPRGLAYSSLHRQLFIALAGDDAMIVLEAATRRHLQTVPMRFGDEPSRLLLAPEEQRIFVLNRGSNSVTVLSTPSMQEIGRISVGPGPRSLARDSRSGHLYVACETSSEVQVYDTVRLQPVTSLVVDSTPTEIAFDEAARKLYVASGVRRRILTVDVSTGEVTSHIDLCAIAEGLVVEPVSRRIYATAGRCREVAVLTPTASMEIRAIALDDAPGLLALTADRRRILATLPAVDRLAICNVAGSRVEFTVETGRLPYAVIAP